MRELYVVAHNMRSTFNVGSLLRTAEGLGVKKVYLTGYTPYPAAPDDTRLPHLARKLSQQIHKTALGAETLVAWEYIEDIHVLLGQLRIQGIHVAALEQSYRATPVTDYHAPDKFALLLGEEVGGIPAELLETVDTHLVIPMEGRKESFNVIIAAAMALYQFRLH